MAGAGQVPSGQVDPNSNQDGGICPRDVPKGPTDRDFACLVHVSSRIGPGPSSFGDDVFAKDHAARKRALLVYLKRLAEADIPGSDLACAYLRRLYRRNSKANTLAANGTNLLQFLEFVYGIGRKSLAEITSRDIEAFVEFGQDRGLKPTSVKNKLGSVYAFCGWLVRENELPAEVVARKFRIKVPDGLPQAMEPEDVRALLSVFEAPRDRAMILVLLRTGMRIGELLRTRVRDVLFEDRKITLYEGEKNRTGRVAYLSEDALLALLAWMRVRDPEKPVLFYAQGRRSMCYSTAREIFFAGLKKAGLERKGYHLHCLRHTFASELLNAGMRLEVLQQLLGHTSLEVTRRYARLTDRTREEEYFRAMTIIQRGEIHGHYRLDH